MPPTPHRHLPLFVLFLLLLLLPPLPQAKLILTYFILRHGARNALPKTSTLQESGIFGGPTLLPQGKTQAYEVGQAFRARYLDPVTCQQTDTCLTPPEGAATYGMVDLERPDAEYSNYNTMINSSALHRTELTAGSFLLGAFYDPQQQAKSSPPYLAWPMVPVFNAEDGQDWRIRSYTKCPAYNDALERWFTSAEFKRKETETQALRDKVQQVLVGGGILNMNVSLATWWNIYDRFNVWKTYKIGDAMPDIDDSLYEQVVELGMWLETSKMRSSLAGNRLGGGLVADMLGHIEKAVKSNQVGLPHYKLLGVVGHYNTQLGLLAALKADQVEEEEVVVPWLTQKIPSPSAILTFELHTNDTQDTNNAKNTNTNTNTYAIRAVLQDGAGKNYQPVPLPCSVGGKEEGYPCPLPVFLSLATPQAMNAGEWCEACDNVDMLACQAAEGQRSKGKGGNKKRKYHSLR